MPDPEKLLTTIRRAVDLTRRTPGRHGRVIHVSAGSEVLVAGDLHGNIGNLQLLLRAADLARQPRRHLVLQELIHSKFEYPDGSDKSHQAVDLWCALKCQFPERVHFLPGNHELAQATNRPIAKGDADLNARFRDGVRHAYGRRAEEIYAAYLELFLALPLVITTANRVFLSHTIPPPATVAGLDPLQFSAASEHKPEELASGGIVYGMVWGRDVSQENATEFLTKVDADLLITGHIPCEGRLVPNDRQIILDSLGSPADYCLFSTDAPMTHAELVSRIRTL